MSLTFDLDLTELDILAEDLNLARVAFPHEIPYIGESGAERAHHRAQVYQRLRNDGFFSRSGSLRADIEDLVRVWAQPEVVISQVANEVKGDHRFLYRGGWRRRTGVLTSQKGSTLTFSELRPAQVIDKMVRFLPDWRPGYGAPIAFVDVDTSPPRHDGHPDEGIFGGIEAAGPAPSHDPSTTERFFRAPVVRAGVIAYWIREPGTGVRQAREIKIGTLTWFDTTEGRFFLTTETLPDGAERYTLTPADRARIARRLRERVNQETRLLTASNWSGHR